MDWAWRASYKCADIGKVYNTADGLDEMLADFGDAMDTDSLEEEPTADAKDTYWFSCANSAAAIHY
jgi:hypothetical protein